MIYPIKEIYFRPWEGIDDQSIENASYWRKLENFHATPIVKVFYQFVSSTYRNNFNLEYVELHCSRYMSGFSWYSAI